jgi:hypothetical protein
MKYFFYSVLIYLVCLTNGCDSSTEPKDCAGVSGGNAFIDDCGVCISEESGLAENYLMDCAGVCAGTSSLDNCGNCDEDETNDCEMDCSGEWGGTAFLDDCSICDNNPQNDNLDMDCLGTCFGSHVIDDCNECVLPEDFNQSIDCNEDCNGNAVENECGCVGGNTGHNIDFCYGCTDPEAMDYNPNATVDDGSCEYEDELHFQVLINGTGNNQLMVFRTSILSLNIGDEIGIYDENGITNFNDCSNVRGEILVGSGVWDGSQLDLVAIGSKDNCSIGGVQVPGYVEGNMPTIVIWDSNTNIEKSANVTYENGLDTFGDLLIIITDITF